MLPGLMVFRAINAFMFAMGVGALAATVASWPLAARGSAMWTGHFGAFAVKLSLTFLLGSLAAFALMPATSDTVRQLPPGEEESLLPTVFKLLLLGLCLVVLLQIPSLVTWWTEDRALLSEMTGNERDPLGLHLVPAVIVFSLPVLAVATLVSFALSSILGIAVRAELSFRVLAACVALQGGLVLGGYLALQEVHILSSVVPTFVANASDPVATARVTGWFTRHNQISDAVNRHLIWTFGGYLVILMLSAYLSRLRKPAPTAP